MVERMSEITAALKSQTPYDAGDPAAVEKQKRKAAKKQLERLRVVETLMGTVAGRAWMYELLVFCNVSGLPVVPGDTHFTYFNLGMQNVGRRLMDEINSASPEKYMPMLREGKQDE